MNVLASARDPKRSGKTGAYFNVLNQASNYADLGNSIGGVCGHPPNAWTMCITVAICGPERVA
jgi:hypothetical protein